MRGLELTRWTSTTWGRLAWLALAVLAGGLAVRAVAQWLGALVLGVPVLYGEGSVANAGLMLARGMDPYAAAEPGTFVAANYPPLSYAVAALGSALGPFAGLRIASIAATLGVAWLVARRVGAGRLVTLAIAATFLALFPVQVWGPAHKPDPLALALTAAAVLAAGPEPRRALGFGVLGALAAFAKPTALMPLGAVLLYLLWRERTAGLRSLGALATSLGVLGALSLLFFDPAALFDRLIVRNALPYSAGSAVALLNVATLTLGALALLALLLARGRMRAYVLGALGVVLLGGREGATINYLLDLAVASSLALAPALRLERAGVPLLLAAQLVVATAFFQPLVVRDATGAWLYARSTELAADLPPTTTHLAEESGILIAHGLAPDVDDLFLWARLVSLGVIEDEITPRVEAGEFATVIALVDLARLDEAPLYERQRWPAPLVRAVLGSYRLEIALPGHYRYVPREPLARPADGFVRVTMSAPWSSFTRPRSSSPSP